MPIPSTNSVLAALTDPEGDLEKKVDLLKQLCADGCMPSMKVLAAVFEKMGQATAPDTATAKKMIAELLNQLQAGPLRQGVYVGLLDYVSSVPRGEVILENGEVAFVTFPDTELAKEVQAGDRVLMDKGGVAILKHSVARLSGVEAELTRKVDSRHVEVTDHQQGKTVMLASAKLLKKLDSGEVELGATVLVNQLQKVCFDALPKVDGFAHFKFLSRESVPDVVVDRDIGNPPAIINRITEFVRLEMTQPELRRRYGLRRTSMSLLAGVSGSGKTLAIQAIHRQMYGIMSDLTGLGIDVLPPRVFRLKLSTMLSMWLGESDKNMDRFFSEVEQMADEPFICPKGRRYTLPVLAIMEEVDGIARQRGAEGHHDRIMTTMLQRLDSTRAEMKHKLIVFLGTTNDAHHVDRAFLRRIGGTIEQFGRLDKVSFYHVLCKHLNKVPSTKASMKDMAGWLFDQNGDEQPMLYITYSGRNTPEGCYRRHFLTGSVVDSSVQEAAQIALQAELNGLSVGITTEELQYAFNHQIANIADQITEQNAHHYLDLPSGSQVANVRRVR